jgi:EAL domain-containing protein (putative c-di-GMP-specific phosphodiesterase class I)/FixJ family two-component response regulator
MDAKTEQTTRRILVVDDEPELGQLVADAAEEAGFDAVVCSDAEEFRVAYADDYDVVVLDILMPQTDGIELLRFLADKHSGAQVLLMSGFDKRVLSTAEELARALGLRVLGHLSKPLRIAELVDLLASSVGIEGAKASKPRGNGTTREGELRRAIREQEFVLHYQPQVSIATNEVVGMEALVRWQHPERGLVYPDEFIGAAESMGLIDDLTWIVVNKSFAEMREWLAAHHAPTVSINVSAQTLTDLSLPDRLSAITTRHNVSASRLVVEVTESGLIEEFAKALDILARLRVKGISLSIDDFGNGYSMMQQLRRVPANELKIDRSFVEASESDESARVIVEQTIALGHKLGMKVVAEGIETESQLELLRQLGCDIGQGYLFSRPVPMPEFSAWLDKWSGGAVAKGLVS